MVYFIGAGPGAPDLITIRGMNLLQNAEIIIYAGSLVNPELLNCADSSCKIYNSAFMTLDEIINIIKEGHTSGLNIVRLHSGDPSLYGAIREQIDKLRELNIPFETVPGVSSFSAAAAALNAEFTLPGISQTLILTRMEGRTPVPEREDIKKLAEHGTSMAIFLSAGMLKELCTALTANYETGEAYSPETPVALVYKASWPEQKILRTTLAELPKQAQEANIHKTAIILVGDFLKDFHENNYELSKLYDVSFEHEFRKIY